MDLSSLEIFEAVAEQGSITRAATVLGRVPSNVTSRVQQLEADLQVSLFSRKGRKMALTEEGETFRHYAQRLRELANEARQALRSVRPSGRLTLGTMESTAVSRLPDVLTRYRSLFPDVSLQLEMGASQDLVHEVLAGSLDCALVARPPEDATDVSLADLDLLLAEKVFSEELLIVVPSTHQQIRSQDDLQTCTLVALEPSCTYRRIAAAWGSAAFTNTIQVSSYHAILASVAAGDSAGVMPRSVYERLQWPAQPALCSLGWVDTLFIRRRSVTNLPVDALGELLLAS
ncbi:MAG: LysR family transcriptional regulator [Pseudorhizobium sp.]